MTESTRHREAFELYWRMGAHRSIERLHTELEALGSAPGLRTLYEWSRTYGWQQRIAGLEREARRAEDDVRVQALREMQDRHAKEALLLQQKGAEWITAKGGDDATADAAIRAIVEGARMERLARGEPTERQEVKAELELHTRLGGLSDEQLDHLIGLAEGALDGTGETAPG